MRRYAVVLIGGALLISMAAWAMDRPIFFSLVVAAAIAAAAALLAGVALRVRFMVRGGALEQRRHPVSLGKGLVAAAVSYLVFVGWAHYQVSQSAAYGLAVAAAHRSAEFTETLGPPVAEGWFVDSEFIYGDPEVATLPIPVRGQVREGLLRATAIKGSEGWRLTELVLEVPQTNSTIRLLDSGQAATVGGHSGSSPPRP